MKRNSIFVIGAIALALFASCASAPASKEAEKPAKPEPVPFDGTTQVVDLTTGWAPIMPYFKMAEDYSYVNAKNLEFFQFPLAEPLNSGDSIDVTIKGKNNGSTGFRVWLTDGQQTTLANIYSDAIGEKLPAGDFDITFTLTATGAVENLFIKGPAYGTNIDNIDVSSITIVYK